MLGKSVLAAMLLSLVTTTAWSQSVEQKRKLYALTDAAPAYCPDIETGWFTQGAIGYDMSSDEQEVHRFQAARQEWLDMFRRGPGRKVVCEQIMDQFGPGGSPELFQFK